MIKKIFLVLLFAIFFIPIGDVFSNENFNSVNVYFFWGEGCPHCSTQKPFLDELKQKHPEIEVYSYEIWKNKDNQKLLIEFGKKLNVNVAGVPFTVIGEKHFTGWNDKQSTGKAIEDAVKLALKNNHRDIGVELSTFQIDDSINLDENIDLYEKKDNKEQSSLLTQKIKLPIFGEIEIKDFSLPMLTIVLGALDGFNPCAMWTLIFLITLLLGMKDRKRMWILGTTFIVASAAVYFFFMAAWLNLILFIGFIAWVRIIIGLVAILGGGYNLREFFTNHELTCKVTGSEKRQKVFEKLKNITHQKSFFLALFGIIVLAFAVNLVELICSAGLPAIYTQVLALSDLPSWQYYLYILLYIVVFMLDDLFVFFVAMTTLKMTGITNKYSLWSHLIGGILMLIIGLLLIVKPEWLMFG